MKYAIPIFALALGLAVIRTAPAEEAPNPAAEVLTRVTHALAGTQRFSCRMNLDFRIQSDGMNQQIHSGYLIALERPNRFAFLHLTGMPTASFISNGKELYSYSPVFNRYLVEPAPAEPILAEPAPAEPALAEPALAEPAPAEPELWQ